VTAQSTFLALGRAVGVEVRRIWRSRRSAAKARRGIAGSLSALVPADWAEALEPRRMLTVAPTLSAPNEAYLGAAYVVGISTNPWDDAYTNSTLSLDWGDGEVDTLPLDATSASHV
jgi:hypothetical protein